MHVQDDVNLCILHMLKDTFSVDGTHRVSNKITSSIFQEGPMVEGISPVEANDRLQIFQVSHHQKKNKKIK